MLTAVQLDFQRFLPIDFKQYHQLSVNSINSLVHRELALAVNLSDTDGLGLFTCVRAVSMYAKTMRVTASERAESYHHSYLTYSLVLLMICKVRGLMPVGNFSSAKLKGISSPVSRFFIITLARISYGKIRQLDQTPKPRAKYKSSDLTDLFHKV